MTNPEVARTKETNGANLVQGFANLIEDLAGGKGIVQRRTDPTAFEKGKTIAATPGEVVFENELFQLIQYDPATDKVAAEPLLYVPPLVNRFYMIDLVPRQSLVKWLVDEGRTVFVISWVNPTEEHKDKGVEDYVLDGVVEAIERGPRERTGRRPTCSPSAWAEPWSPSRWPGWPPRRADEVNSATLIGSLVDFADMRDWSAFVHEGHLAALEDHLEAQGYIDSLELQRLFAAMRANDLIWSSVVNHYLLDKPAPAVRPALLGSRTARASRPPSSRATTATCCSRTSSASPPASRSAARRSTSRDPDADAGHRLKDDHVSALAGGLSRRAVTRRRLHPRRIGPQCRGHQPPAANKHGFWTNETARRRRRMAGDGATATKAAGGRLDPVAGEQGLGKTSPPAAITDGIEPAPGRYAKMP